MTAQIQLIQKQAQWLSPLGSGLRSNVRYAYACLTIVRILSGTSAAGFLDSSAKRGAG